MDRQTAKAIYTLGFWAALLAALFAIAYDIGQIIEWAGLMGSGGGPENNSTWSGLVVLLVPLPPSRNLIRRHDGGPPPAGTDSREDSGAT